MSKYARLFIIICAVALTGCAATVNRASSDEANISVPTVPSKKVAVVITGNQAVKASSDWHTFCAEWRTAFDAAASSAGLSFGYFESDPGDQPVGTTFIKIFINDYRYLTSGARYGLGIMTGNAYIDADAEFVELPAKRRLGNRKYTTSSSAWQGVFSAMTDKQVAALSKEMLQDVTGK